MASKRLLRLLLISLGAMALIAGTLPAQANHSADQHKKMDLLSTSPNAAINSDLAFWGNYLFIGYYTGDAESRGGVRIFDISNPGGPQLIKDVECDGQQNDPIVWDRDGNGVPDLLMLAVDRTMEGPDCGDARSVDHGDPDGWEGVRIFEMSDDPANPFETVEQVAAVYTHCGAHTITLWPGLADQGRLQVYVSSYPLRPGPTCGEMAGRQTDPPRDPLHGVIQVIDVPLANPEDSEVIAEPPINYPGDPDNQIDWTERGLVAPGVLEEAARACHDISVHVSLGLAAGACAEQGQLWNVDPATGIPDTANPIWISDDEVTSGGTGDIPGAIDFFHSATFSNDGSVVNWIDESFGDGCPPETEYQAREWNPDGGVHKTGRMFFVDGGTGSFISEFQVGDLRPEPNAYCSAHMGLPIANINRDLLVNAWYMGGVNVINFSNPSRLREVAHYDIAPDGVMGSDNWSAYSYVGPSFRRGRGIPVYASDGVHNPPSGRGLLVFRTNVQKPGNRVLTHLNPQTQGE